MEPRDENCPLEENEYCPEITCLGWNENCPNWNNPPQDKGDKDAPMPGNPGI